MNNKNKWVLMRMVSALKDKVTYIKSMEVTADDYDESFYDGMTTAYHIIMEEIKQTIEENDLDLKEFDLDNFDTNEILNYKPKIKHKE